MNSKDYFDDGFATKNNPVKNRVMICIEGPSVCTLHEPVVLNINIVNVSKRPLKRLILGLGSGNDLDGLGKLTMEYIVKVGLPSRYPPSYLHILHSLILICCLTQENMVRLHEIPIGESINSSMAIIPLKTGILKLDNFFIVEETDSREGQKPNYFQHVYNIYVV